MGVWLRGVRFHTPVTGFLVRAGGVKNLKEADYYMDLEWRPWAAYGRLLEAKKEAETTVIHLMSVYRLYSDYSVLCLLFDKTLFSSVMTYRTMSKTSDGHGCSLTLSCPFTTLASQ